jgi:hypothetical protein
MGWLYYILVQQVLYVQQLGFVMGKNIVLILDAKTTFSQRKQK